MLLNDISIVFGTDTPKGFLTTATTSPPQLLFCYGAPSRPATMTPGESA